jgi:hypothetical protein
MKAVKDPTFQMVQKIYTMYVPEKSELSNPFSANKRQKNKLLSQNKNNVMPENIVDWNSRNFVDYFVSQYKSVFNGVYKKTYSSDCSIINEIFDFMSANELDEKEWAKKFIDWCFINNDHILKNSGSFLLMNTKHYLNTFFQQVITKNKQSMPIIDIYDELKTKIENGKTKEILAIYGIPIVATYFINQKNIDEKNIKVGLNKLFSTLISGDFQEQEYLKKIVQRSINRSPYPDFFHLKDWRNDFIDLQNKYKNETWWRDQDYKGQSQFKFDRFMKIE